MAGRGSVSKFSSSFTAGFVWFGRFVFNNFSSKKNNAEPPPGINPVEPIPLILKPARHGWIISALSGYLSAANGDYASGQYSLWGLIELGFMDDADKIMLMPTGAG